MNATDTVTRPVVSPRPLALALWHRTDSLSQRERLEKAVELFKGNAVVRGEGAFLVTSATGQGRYRVGLDLSSCTCPDHHRGNLCKHVLAAGLELAATEELPSKKLPTLTKLYRRQIR